MQSTPAIVVNLLFTKCIMPPFTVSFPSAGSIISPVIDRLRGLYWRAKGSALLHQGSIRIVESSQANLALWSLYQISRSLTIALPLGLCSSISLKASLITLHEIAITTSPAIPISSYSTWFISFCIMLFYLFVISPHLW